MRQENRRNRRRRGGHRLADQRNWNTTGALKAAIETAGYSALGMGDAVVRAGIGDVLDEVGIPHPGVVDLADTHEAAQFRKKLAQPGKLTTPSVQAAPDVHGRSGLLVSGATPPAEVPPSPGVEIPTDAQLDHLSEYAPTGTVADALHARDALFDFLTRRHESVANFLDTIADQFNPPMPPEVQLSIYSGWVTAVASPDAALTYVAPDLVDTILEAADTMPEIGSVADLELPMEGTIVLGKPISAGTDPTDPHADWIPRFSGNRATVISWNLIAPQAKDTVNGAPADRESWLLTVTPWARAGAAAASYIHGDVVEIADRVTGAEMISGPLVPSCPAWVDGDYPRDRADDGEGGTYGWEDEPNFYIRFVAALALWIQQEVVREEDGLPDMPRPDRRALERKAKKTGQKPKVTTIKLRRLERNARPASEFGGEREYTCQWFVRGHWRKYWIGSGEDRRRVPRYIARYIAGPEDMPLKVDGDRVWKVDR